jgi:hypothetical protein
VKSVQRRRQLGAGRDGGGDVFADANGILVLAASDARLKTRVVDLPEEATSRRCYQACVGWRSTGTLRRSVLGAQATGARSI